jgi:type IV pilus assembly protein PilN
MYSLEINFLKDRPGYLKESESKVKQKVDLGNLTPIYIGVGVGVFLPAVAGLAMLFLQLKTGELTQTIGQIEAETKALDTKIGNIQKIKGESKRIQGETTALVTVFDQIRPWSAMLQDLRDRIPARVQIENIKHIPVDLRKISAQKTDAPKNLPGDIEIEGFARTFADVNDFLLSVEQSKFLDGATSKIANAELVDAPKEAFTIPKNNQSGQDKIQPPKVVKYTIKASLSNEPASDLIQELERKGSLGLVTRLRNIQKIGVIAK